MMVPSLFCCHICHIEGAVHLEVQSKLNCLSGGCHAKPCLHAVRYKIAQILKIICMILRKKNMCIYAENLLFTSKWSEYTWTLIIQISRVLFFNFALMPANQCTKSYELQADML